MKRRHVDLREISKPAENNCQRIPRITDLDDRLLFRFLVPGQRLACLTPSCFSFLRKMKEMKREGEKKKIEPER